jgi:dienelactone hydrolase
MTSIIQDKARTPQSARRLTYGHSRVAGQTVALEVDLFVPDASHLPAPVLVWLGADVLSVKSGHGSGLRLLAHWLAPEGIAVAVPKVRVGADRSDVQNHVIERLPDIERHRDLTVPTDMSSFEALAAMEDLCTFLDWVATNGQSHGLSGKVVLAGSATGAAMAFNVACVAPYLGLARPHPIGLLSYSGTCAWPGLYPSGSLKTFALHNPTDRKIGIGPIRKMAHSDQSFELIEAIEQAHGSLGLWPGESPQAACDRILARVKRWCA